jgi:hypothetical protein
MKTSIFTSINGQGKWLGVPGFKKTDYEALNFREQKSSLQK